MKKIVLLMLFMIANSQVKATISQIRWGSTTGPLNGLTIDWSGTGAADKLKWGYTSSYEKGEFVAGKRAGIISGISFYRYSFPVVNPNSTIYYQLYDSETLTWITGRTYNTAPPSTTNTFNFIAQGDSRSNMATVWKNISEKVDAKNSAFTIFSGDVTNSGNVAGEYNSWFSSAEEYLANNIVYHSQGNHDLPETASYYQNIFELPKNNPANTELYYSFKYGNALFISLNSEDTYSATSAQSIWLKDLLETSKNDASITWRIVFFHESLVNAGAHYGEGDTRRNHWGTWFDDNDVDLILNGHDHNYQRTKPLNISSSGVVTSTATQYGTAAGKGMCQIICGGSGAGLYSQGANSDVAHTALFYQGFNYVHVNIADKILTATVYGLGSSVSATATESVVETVVIDKSTTLSVAELEDLKQNPINVYPNPVEDRITLRYSSEQKGEAVVKIYDMSAREVSSFRANKTAKKLEQSFDVSKLPNGIYNISVMMGNHKDTTMFIKK